MKITLHLEKCRSLTIRVYIGIMLNKRKNVYKQRLAERRAAKMLATTVYSKHPS